MQKRRKTEGGTRINLQERRMKLTLFNSLTSLSRFWYIKFLYHAWKVKYCSLMLLLLNIYVIVVAYVVIIVVKEQTNEHRIR